MTAYDRLREIGVSVETADALAPILDGLPAKKREAFILWASGMSERKVAEMCSTSRKVIRNVIKSVRGNYKKGPK